MRLNRESKPCLCGCGYNAQNQMSYSSQLVGGQANCEFVIHPMVETKKLMKE